MSIQTAIQKANKELKDLQASDPTGGGRQIQISTRIESIGVNLEFLKTSGVNQTQLGKINAALHQLAKAERAKMGHFKASEDVINDISILAEQLEQITPEYTNLITAIENYKGALGSEETQDKLNREEFEKAQARKDAVFSAKKNAAAYMGELDNKTRAKKDTKDSNNG